MSFKSWFYSRMNGWFTLSAITAFLAMISYFHINSYFADKHKLNTFFLVTGIVLTVISVGLMVMANKKSTGTGG